MRVGDRQIAIANKDLNKLMLLITVNQQTLCYKKKRKKWVFMQGKKQI